MHTYGYGEDHIRGRKSWWHTFLFMKCALRCCFFATKRCESHLFNKLGRSHVHFEKEFLSVKVGLGAVTLGANNSTRGLNGDIWSNGGLKPDPLPLFGKLATWKANIKAIKSHKYMISTPGIFTRSHYAKINCLPRSLALELLTHSKTSVLEVITSRPLTNGLESSKGVVR